ncbi:nuclear transport factor 2 family protein [Streptomyces sp. NPDC048172]|uniref:nuclear transport factor 2 family protein n=1 Tax=Streptomyces sp. NPDC048172 TaxID=3365505 RepID=UPI00371E41A7
MTHETGEASEQEYALLLRVAEDWAEAIVSDDAARIGAFMAEEWTIVGATGPATREQFLALVASGDLTHSAMRFVGPPRIRVYGDTAVVTGRITNTAHYRGQRYDADEWTTDVFVRRAGGWLCALTHLTPVATPANVQEPGDAEAEA